MKIKWLYLSAVLLTIGCSKSQDRTMQHLTSKHSATSHSQVDYQSKDPRKEEQSLSSVNINMDCVKTEGDYETDSHCIRISNVGDRTKSSEVYFDIIDKNASHKERHKGRIWDWISKKGNLYIYGFQAKDSSKLYEIDWRDDNATYFRIWDSKRQHKYLEEKVIRGPKELLVEVAKALGKPDPYE
mgnify:CR=1 FL=1